MQIQKRVIVNNTNEVRLDEVSDWDGQDVDIITEELEDMISNYCGRDSVNWYDNDIVATMKIENIEIKAKVSYSFSSEFYELVAVKDEKTIYSNSYENNQVDYEWNPYSTPDEFIAEIMIDLLKLDEGEAA